MKTMNKAFDVPSPNPYSLSGEPTTRQPVDRTVYIDNIITVYDTNGNIIKQYDGKFAILRHDNFIIIFENENGEKHTIHISSGVVTIDQKDKENPN